MNVIIKHKKSQLRIKISTSHSVQIETGTRKKINKKLSIAITHLPLHSAVTFIVKW